MTLKNLKLALLAVMSVMWAGCDKETSLDDTYADILLYVSETTVWETIRVCLTFPIKNIIRSFSCFLSTFSPLSFVRQPAILLLKTKNILKRAFKPDPSKTQTSLKQVQK